MKTPALFFRPDNENGAMIKASFYRWYVVILLLLIFILSYFDRFILSLLVEPIKTSLHLTDFQIGLLLGPAFSLFNVAAALPLGWYADRSNRKYLLIAGIILWCSMTASSGFVVTFLPLFLLRLGLGLGEAVVSPASISIISDYFGRKERARAISVYCAGTYLGAGLAFLVGGNIVGWLEGKGQVHILSMGPFEPWQAAFVIVGAPGILLALALFSIREPSRGEQLALPATDAPPIGITRYILARWRGFGVLFVGSTCNYAMSTLTFWNVPLFQRVWNWDVASVGTVTGLLYFTAGPIGTAVAVWAVRKFTHRYPDDGAMRTLLLGLLIGIPASALYPIMPSPQLAVLLMFVAFIGKSVATAAGPASLALITPGNLRARGVAVFNTVIALLGPLLGPPLIGWIVDSTGNPRTVGMVMAGFVACIGIPAILVVATGLGQYRRTHAALAEELARADAATAGEIAGPETVPATPRLALS